MRLWSRLIDFFAFIFYFFVSTFSRSLLLGIAKSQSEFCIWNRGYILIIDTYTLTSVCIFSILALMHFLRCWQGEFVYQSKASFVGDHFLYSQDLNVWFSGDNVGRNLMLVTLRVLRVNILRKIFLKYIQTWSLI